MAVLPHYSPGYPEWDIAEQPRLLELMQRTRKQPFPAHVDVLDSGMLRPKKSLLAVFGLTRHTDRLRRLTDLVPCENCSFAPCQYRRAPYRRRSAIAEQLPVRVAIARPGRRVHRESKALNRWADERLSMHDPHDGTHRRALPLRRHHLHQHGPAAGVPLPREAGPAREGYPIREQRCAPGRRRYRPHPDVPVSRQSPTA